MNRVDDPIDIEHMQRALSIAKRGLGFVEPNPMVGCVIARDGVIVGEGWHQRFGAAHAEVNAIANAGDAQGATAYVTLEPCCHTGKTPPCTQALIDAKIQRVVVAIVDPSEKVAGQGIQQLREAGIDVHVGVCQADAATLIAPFRKLSLAGRPWLIAKWAMSLDGKIATRSGDSQWISNESSREIVHKIRARVDGILIGSGTAKADDPRLTARIAAGETQRVATRIVVDWSGSISDKCQLIRSIDEAPLLLAVGEQVSTARKHQLSDLGCEVLVCGGNDRNARLQQLIVELGRRNMTNVLCEGGAKLFGSLFDLHEIDEVHAFIAPKLIGGEAAIPAFAGMGIPDMGKCRNLQDVHIETVAGNLYVRGFVSHERDDINS